MTSTMTAASRAPCRSRLRLAAGGPAWPGGSIADLLADEDPRGIETINDLDTEPVLLQRHDSRRQRKLIRQRGEAVSGGRRAHGWSSLMQIAIGNPGRSQLAS